MSVLEEVTAPFSKADGVERIAESNFANASATSAHSAKSADQRSIQYPSFHAIACRGVPAWTTNDDLNFVCEFNGKRFIIVLRSVGLATPFSEDRLFLAALFDYQNRC